MEFNDLKKSSEDFSNIFQVSEWTVGGLLRLSRSTTFSRVLRRIVYWRVHQVSVYQDFSVKLFTTKFWTLEHFLSLSVRKDNVGFSEP